MIKKMKVIVIGGGPAGMSAAIFAARKCKGEEVVLVEKNQFPGRKLLATGNGRCNITNTNCENHKVVEDFFKDMGIVFREEGEGRVYPYTEQATTIKEVLENEMNLLGIKTIYEKEVYGEGVTYINGTADSQGHFLVKGKDFQIKADNIILATGGKAGPQYGSTGEGYTMAGKFGHSLVKPIPSLVQLTSPEKYFRLLKGVRVKGNVAIVQDEMIDNEDGEIQFTETGLSGICIFNLSRNMRFNQEKKSEKAFKIILDLMVNFSEEEVKKIIIDKTKRYCNKGREFVFNGLVNKKLEKVLAEQCLEKNIQPWEILKRWEIPVDGTKGFKEAQVTSGGIPLNQVNTSTMESLIKEKLFFAGEILDYDGKCGGYNLQWAFETGIKAGGSIHV